MAVWTDRSKIVDRVDLIGMSNCRDVHQMVYMNELCHDFGSIEFCEIKTTDETDRTPMGDAIGSCSWASFESINENLPSSPFGIATGVNFVGKVISGKFVFSSQKRRLGNMISL